MMNYSFVRTALGISASVLLLAACGGSQPPIVAPGTMPQTDAITTRAGRGGSWMLPEAKSDDLLYAVGGCDGTCILSYPSGKTVGSLSVGGIEDSDCADTSGNVFITHESAVYEYAHGGSSPIATLTLPGDNAKGCSVDPSTGNLAVVFNGNGGDIAIFQGAQGTPSVYASHLESTYCGYDASGDLFVDGFGESQPGLAEMINGSSGFIGLTISSTVGQPGQVQWDGSYITYESATSSEVSISRLAISGSAATVVSAAQLKGTHHGAWASWIYKHIVLAPIRDHGIHATKIGVWPYPAGGERARALHKFDWQPVGVVAVALSIGSDR